MPSRIIAVQASVAAGIAAYSVTWQASVVAVGEGEGTADAVPTAASTNDVDVAIRSSVQEWSVLQSDSSTVKSHDEEFDPM